MKQKPNEIIHNANILGFKKTWLAIAVAITLNYLFSFIAEQTGLPIFLNTIFTVITSCLLGGIPGLIVGLVSNLLNVLIDYTSIYFAFISGIIAILAAVMMKRGMFRKWWGYILAIILFALIGGGLGYVVTYNMYPEDVSVETINLVKTLNGAGLSAFWSNWIYVTLWDLLDKTITVIFLFAALYFYPQNEKALSYFPYSHLTKKPWSSKEYKTKSHSIHDSLHSVRARMLFIMVPIYIFLAITVAISYSVFFQNSGRENFSRITEGYSLAVKEAVNGDKISYWLENGADEEYDKTYAELESMYDREPLIKYIYVYSFSIHDGDKSVFDIDPEGYALGEEVPRDFPPDDLALVLAGEEINHHVETNDEWGHLMTWYTPIKDSNNTTVAYAGVDIEISSVTTQNISNITKMTAIELLIFIIGAAILYYWLSLRLIAPAQALDTELLTYERVDPGKWFESEERKDRVSIDSKDEIEELAKSIHKVEDFSAQQYATIEEQAAIILRSQKSVIFSLSEIVESRDACTGDHIKRTSNYVRMIATELKREGKHPDFITDQYIEDITTAAVLHDIGKIKISDIILNKPGKFTDEEFDIMKTHTTEGEHIIDMALEGVTGSTYLTYAREIAGCHQEWWNGNGYPRNLKGEEIPYSARIMAVADVFDALVSKRPYKKGFPVEKAVSIMQKERGTHFDPEVADAFLAIKDDMLKEYMKNYTED